MSELRHRLFIVGVPRSGTTLLQSFLAAHSEIASFTESHLFSRHFSFLPGSSRPFLRRRPAGRAEEFLRENGVDPQTAKEWVEPLRRLGRLGRELRTDAAARAMVELLDRLAAERGPVTAWVEKTPRHLRFVPAVERALDPAVRATVHVIHVVRQPVPTVASLREASQNWETAYDLDACIERWNDDVAFTVSRLSAPRQHLVFYEDLTTTTERVLERLLDEIGLPWEASVLDGYREQADRLTTATESWKAQTGRSVEPSRAAERSLSSAEREKVARSVRSGLYEEAYDRHHQRPPDSP